MKTVYMKRIASNSLFVLLLLLSTLFSFSQAMPDYSFTTATLDSGSDRQVGAVYRFTNVKTGTDAFIKIVAISGSATIQKLDRTTDGYAEAFQPEIRVPAHKNGYIDFQISFVKAGTSLRINQPEIKASALDIDGDISGSGVLYEYNEINMGGGVASFNTTGLQIQVTPVGTAFQATNITGTLFGASVDTSALDVMYTVKNAGINTFTWRTGVNNLLNNASANRYTSLYFKDFSYNGVVLAMPKILNFEGNARNNTVSLNWKLDIAENGYTCVLERAGEDNHFISVEGISKTSATDYTYSGSLGTGRSLYRVRLTGPDDQVKYSNVISFSKGTAGDVLKVYPSIVNTQQFTVNIAAEIQQQGSLRVVDYAGRVVYKKDMVLSAGSNSITVNDLSSSLKGNYLVVASAGNARYTNKIIIQ